MSNESIASTREALPRIEHLARVDLLEPCPRPTLEGSTRGSTRSFSGFTEEAHFDVFSVKRPSSMAIERHGFR